MDASAFVQNIKFYCERQRIKPTVACRESGAGKDLINQIERQRSMPSVEKVQLLAQYLGVTVSELLGEAPPGSGGAELSPQDRELLDAYHNASAEARRIIDGALEPYKEKTGAQAG